ncbi:unnamed protein product [Paramecium pentaurelia]|uniref:Transmembrane protein n=1 Tax=Paramecium pentaurelia TaxID=43138 RepID=A0A8S1WY67_9CILI|nr:unnamed protein product [Paramecium pentaurelia]
MYSIPKQIKNILRIEIIFIIILIIMNITLYFLNIAENNIKTCSLSFNAIERCFNFENQLMYKQRMTNTQCDYCSMLLWLMPINIIMLFMMILIIINKIRYYIKNYMNKLHFVEIIYFGLQFVYNLFILFYIFKMPINQNYRTKLSPLIILFVESLINCLICILLKIDQIYTINYLRVTNKKESQMQIQLLL